MRLYEDKPCCDDLRKPAIRVRRNVWISIESQRMYMVISQEGIQRSRLRIMWDGIMEWGRMGIRMKEASNLLKVTGFLDMSKYKNFYSARRVKRLNAVTVQFLSACFK